MSTLSRTRTPSPTRNKSQIDIARVALKTSGEYAAGQNLLSRVHWERNDDMLYLGERANGHGRDMSSSPAPAALSILVHIIDEDCFLTHHSLWRPDTGVTSFAEAHFSFIGVAPEPSNVEFDRCLLNISKLFCLASPDSGKHDGVVNEACLDVQSITLRHWPYQPLSKGQVKKDEPTHIGRELPLAIWNLESQAELELMEEISGKYNIIGLRAFDMYGDQIAASDYDSHLRGAIVAIRFTLTKNIAIARDDEPGCFFTEIESVRVVVPPNVAK